MLEDSELALNTFLRTAHAVERKDDAREPAWKRRRRA
jgi:hypothetical protein